MSAYSDNLTVLCLVEKFSKYTNVIKKLLILIVAYFVFKLSYVNMF
jgi:hypothetical protein